jgi:hypothetical protein
VFPFPLLYSPSNKWLAMKFSSISHGLSIIERPKNVINKKRREYTRREWIKGDEKIIIKKEEGKLFRKWSI